MSVTGRERVPLAELQQQQPREQGDWDDGILSDLQTWGMMCTKLEF